jgi:hypothetical protein
MSAAANVGLAGDSVGRPVRKHLEGLANAG